RRAAPRARAAAAEQRFEEIAETAVLVVELEVVALAEVRRRTEVVAGAESAALELVVGLALLGVLEHLVRLVDRLETLLGVLFLADVGVVLARELPVRRLDLVGRGVLAHAQGV